jgi:hypothetical protein
MSRHTATRRRSGGQALVLLAGGMVALLAMVALVVDGGNAWSQQRIVQNGSDASAEGGAIVLARKLAGVPAPVGGWDTEVNTQVLAGAAINGITVTAAYYTDICGIPLQADGSAATHPDGRENLSVAVRVGSGSLPLELTTTPDCPTSTVGPPAGVLVLGTKVVRTYLANVVGLSTVNVSTRATAVSGYLQGFCDAAQGNSCAILPVAIPVNVVNCDGSNNPVFGTPPTPYVPGIVYKIPLCQNGPGNVGWLDWTPTGGGIPELESSILTPDNPAIDLPSWQYVTQTGNVNSPQIEDAINTYAGQVVMIPQFDATCSDDPTPGTAVSACPSGSLGGNGSNQWYHMPSFGFLRLCDPSIASCNGLTGAYITGSNGAECDSGGNGATSCLIGEFVGFMSGGTVGPGVGGGTGTGTKAVGVQLIK